MHRMINVAGTSEQIENEEYCRIFGQRYVTRSNSGCPKNVQGRFMCNIGTLSECDHQRPL